MVEKIKTDVDRLLFVSRLKKSSILSKYIGNFLSFSKPNIPGESIGLKFIRSQSELFRFIPNQSKKRFVSCLMKNGKKSMRLNLNSSETSTRSNLTASFQSRSIRINPSLGLIQTEFSIKINPNHSDLGFIRIDSD